MLITFRSLSLAQTSLLNCSPIFPTSIIHLHLNDSNVSSHPNSLSSTSLPQPIPLPKLQICKSFSILSDIYPPTFNLFPSSKMPLESLLVSSSLGTTDLSQGLCIFYMKSLLPLLAPTNSTYFNQ